MSSLPKEMWTNLKRPVLFFWAEKSGHHCINARSCTFVFHWVLSGVGHIFVWCYCVLITRVTLQSWHFNYYFGAVWYKPLQRRWILHNGPGQRVNFQCILYSVQILLTVLYNVLTFVFAGCKKSSMWHITGASKFRTILASLQLKKQDARKIAFLVPFDMHIHN